MARTKHEWRLQRQQQRREERAQSQHVRPQEHAEDEQAKNERAPRERAHVAPATATARDCGDDDAGNVMTRGDYGKTSTRLDHKQDDSTVREQDHVSEGDEAQGRSPDVGVEGGKGANEAVDTTIISADSNAHDVGDPNELERQAHQADQTSFVKLSSVASTEVTIEGYSMDRDDAGLESEPLELEPHVSLSAPSKAPEREHNNLIEDGQGRPPTAPSAISCDDSLNQAQPASRPASKRSTIQLKATIAQLETDIQGLVQQKMKNLEEQHTLADDTASSLAPSEAATDATEQLDADEHARGDVDDSIGIDTTTVRIRQLEAELAITQRRADTLEAERASLMRSAESQQDYRSQLLAVQVNQRTLAGKLRRAAQTLRSNDAHANDKTHATINELQELAAALQMNHNHQPMILSDTIVFPPPTFANRSGKASKRSWLWETPDTCADEYSMRIMRLTEVPLKKQRVEDLTTSVAGKSSHHEKSTSPDSSRVQLHSPPQVKRLQLEEESSSDEEEFICDVDAFGKVTARQSSVEPIRFENPGAEDVFLTISM